MFSNFEATGNKSLKKQSKECVFVKAHVIIGTNYNLIEHVSRFINISFHFRLFKKDNFRRQCTVIRSKSTLYFVFIAG